MRITGRAIDASVATLFGEMALGPCIAVFLLT